MALTKEDLQAISELVQASTKETREYIDQSTRETRTLIEGVNHNIQLIAEQYCDISAKLDKVNENAAGIGDLKERVRILENVVMKINAELKELKKAQ
jgi:methyl-accepting chemotaxis protein